MSDASPRALLVELLSRLEEGELDCDEFFARLPGWVDGHLVDDEERRRMAHHAAMCADCEEERRILARALGLEEPREG